jgi:hypothetical protein
MINSFRAGPNGSLSQMGIPHGPVGGYTKMQGRTDFNFAGVKGYDTGGEWDNVNFQWKPQAGHIDWCAQGWVMNFGAPLMVNLNLVLSVHKNGVDFWAALGGEAYDTFVNSGAVINCGCDYANGEDIYDFRIYMTTIDGLSSGYLNSDPRHIWLSGKSYGQEAQGN